MAEIEEPSFFGGLAILVLMDLVVGLAKEGIE